MSKAAEILSIMNEANITITSFEGELISRALTIAIKNSSGTEKSKFVDMEDKIEKLLGWK